MLRLQDVVANDAPTSSEHLLNLSLDMDFTRFHQTVPVDDDCEEPALVRPAFAACQPCGRARHIAALLMMRMNGCS